MVSMSASVGLFPGDMVSSAIRLAVHDANVMDDADDLLQFYCLGLISDHSPWLRQLGLRL